MPLVCMPHLRLTAHGTQRSNSANTQQELLTQTRMTVPPVKSSGEMPIFLRIFRGISIQQIEGDPANFDEPHHTGHYASTNRNLHLHHITGRGTCQINRHRHLINRVIHRLLPPLGIDDLPKICLVVHKPDRHQGNSQITGFFEMISRENPQSSAIQRDRAVESEFG